MKTMKWKFAGVALLALAGCAQNDGSDKASLSARVAKDASHAFPTSAKAGPVRIGGAARTFAVLPDRGELTRVDSTRKAHHEGAYTWHPVELSEAHALNAIASGHLTLRAPNGTPIDLRYTRHIEHADGNWTWVGKNAQGQDAVITFGPKAAFGTIPNGAEDPLRLTLAAGRAWLLETDRRVIAATDNALTRPKNDDFLVPPESPVVDPRRVEAAAATAEAAGGTPVIDVVVGYTPGLVSMYSGESQALTRLNNLVDITNTAYVTSQVNAQVRMVKAVAVNYVDNTDNKTALEELTGYKSGVGSAPIPAALQPLHTAREQYGADLISLVRRFNNATNAGCGIAWLLGGGRTSITQSDEDFGMSVVSDSGGNLFPDGGYVCRNETFAHEIGHNLGSAHDVATATTNGVVKYGAFTYSFGYKTGADAGNFYTIMAYGDSGQFKNAVFSNPRISICSAQGNLPCGVTDQADNARSINNTVGIITTFRPTVVPLVTAAAVRNDLNADGKSDIVWRNPGLELQAYWLMNGRQRTTESVRAVSSIYRIVGTGDFDGDRATDLLWTNNTNDLLWIWRSNGAGGYDVQLVSGYPANWRVEGVADLNSDGKSDIIWRNQVIGRMDVWLMNGPSIIGTSPQNVSSTDRFAATGDFDGDSRGDILWTDATGLNVSMWRGLGNGQFDKYAVASVPNGWVVRGATDLNADGKSDVIWQNNGLGIVDYWLMSGTSIIGNRTTPVGSIYRVIATGDFDGDGRGDLLWTNDTNDLLWVWRSQADGGFISELVDGYPPGWSVMNGGS
ncbi:reprolysin-like metallopeptidase [Lysobacter xanthus]